MKPTLDEEISEIAEIAVPKNVHGPVGREKAYERKDIVGWAKSAIYAGIEAWKRQEPTDLMISEAMHCLDGVNIKDHGRTYGEQKYYKYVMRYRAMMSASLRTSETTGEGK